MKKILIIFIVCFLACFTQAQMPIFRGQFTTNVPGAYVRGNSTFGTAGTGTYTFNGQLLTYVDALGGVDFMVSTNIYGTGVPLFIIRNGTAGFNMDSQGSYSVSASSYWGQRYTADLYVFSPSYWLGSVNGLPRMSIFGGGAGFYPQTGTTNWMVWLDTNAAPVSVVSSNGFFGIFETNPQYAVDVNGTVQATNLQLSVPQWNDERVPMSALSSPSSTPGWVTFVGGVSVYGFDKNSEEQLDFELQLPHGIATNEIYGIDIHIHWTGNTALTAGTSNVVWGLEYLFAEVGGTFPASTTTVRITNRLDSVRFHKYSEFGKITNGFGESTVLLGRLFRDGANASDTYDGDALGLSFDIHYPALRLGSFNEDGDY